MLGAAAARCGRPEASESSQEFSIARPKWRKHRGSGTVNILNMGDKRRNQSHGLVFSLVAWVNIISFFGSVYEGLIWFSATFLL